MEPYVDGLCREIELAGALLRERGVYISCAYMGGGTPPTLAAGQLHKILSAVENFLPMGRCAEFTVEAGRPDTITVDKLETLKSHGIRRISINPQTMEDQMLQAIGRSHTAGEIVEAMALAGEHFGGLVNMDLIAGLPADTLAGFGRTLEKVLDMEPANITVHTLALKKGSRLTEEGGELCGPEAVENMLETASARLRGAGYAPYYLYRQKYMSGGCVRLQHRDDGGAAKRTVPGGRGDYQAGGPGEPENRSVGQPEIRQGISGGLGQGGRGQARRRRLSGGIGGAGQIKCENRGKNA